MQIGSGTKNDVFKQKMQLIRVYTSVQPIFDNYIFHSNNPNNSSAVNRIAMHSGFTAVIS